MARMDNPEINITSSISNKNFFSGNAKTIFLEKMEPTKTEALANGKKTEILLSLLF